MHHSAVSCLLVLLLVACASDGGGNQVSDGGLNAIDGALSGDGGPGGPFPASYDCRTNTEVFANTILVPSESATIRAALSEASSQGWMSVKISVAEGHDEGGLSGNLGVFGNALIVAEVPYKAHIRNIDVGSGDKAQHIQFEGFDIGNAPGIVIKMDGGRTTDQNVHHITFRNNIIHDSGSSDVVKINAGSHDITMERNIFYGHNDDTMDLNSVENVFVHDNIFFDKDPGDREFLVIKDSTPVGDPDFFKSTKHAFVRRNIFLSWKGGGNSTMVYLGEDNDRDEYAVQDALIENNLFIGNGNVGSGFAAPIGMRGVRDVTIRNNTFTGAFENGRSWAFLAWNIN
ncbi:MAG: right-handed parallel beta-helix repeat-containing protein [Kofleriaceae bacterium]|nr:right-handed parallel beta-helix repeat-containing protein [Kofleriaceae bacterium]